MSTDELPTLDVHAHIAPDVTPRQVAALGNTTVLAMTRSLDEARRVARRNDQQLIWGVGVHPAVPEALGAYDENAFRRSLQYFSVVGEVGLDRRGDRAHQRAVFDSILGQCKGRPLLISIHSTGRTAEVLDAISNQPHPGAVLHWFNGTPEQIDTAAALGCHFSVNAAMDPLTIARMPPERILTETDFPSSRKRTQASKPGDVTAAEALIGEIHAADPRVLVHDNLNNLLQKVGLASLRATN